MGLQTTPSHVSQYMAENLNFWKSGTPVCHGTVFAPKQCLHQKEATGMESIKCICFVGAKTSVPCAGLQTTPSHVSQCRTETEICGNPGLPFVMVPCLHQSNVYIKRNLRVWIVNNAKISLTCAGLQTTPSHVSQYWAENGNLRKSESTLSHGTVFAPKQCLHQKEATALNSPKMYSSRRCKNLTYLCGTANDSISSKPV